MKKVVIESPFSGNRNKNLEYARKALKHSITLGEAPIASHLLYTQVLDDKNKEERELGINLGFIWNSCAEEVVVYCDLGISKGMEKGIEYAINNNIKVTYRYLFKQED